MPETFKAMTVEPDRTAALPILDDQARGWFGAAGFATLEQGPVSATQDVNGVTVRRTYTQPDAV